MLFWQRIMTLNRMMAPAKRGTLVALAAAAAVLALAEPAHAQYWGGDRFYGGGGGYGGYRSYRQSPQRDFFFPFSGFMRRRRSSIPPRRRRHANWKRRRPPPWSSSAIRWPTGSAMVWT